MANVIVSYAVIEASLAVVVADAQYLKLYTNNYTPTGAISGELFTEATGGGYAHKHVSGEVGNDWSLEANVPRDIIMAEQTFTFTGALGGGASVYGWYLAKQSGGGVVVAAKLLDTPYTPASGGGTLKFTPRIQAGLGTPT
jgi:hypothetical protein